jgi:hypothetical protein
VEVREGWVVMVVLRQQKVASDICNRHNRIEEGT